MEEDIKEITMIRYEFFSKLSQGEIGAWNFEVEPTDVCVDGKVHCFGNDEVYIAMSIGDDDYEHWSYWVIDKDDNHIWVELINMGQN